MKNSCAIILAVVLLGCPKAPSSALSTTEAVDANTVLDLASERALPETVRGKFSAKIRAPGQAIPSLPGVVIVDRPDRIRMVINAPIGGPVFSAVTDGSDLLLFLHRDNKALKVNTADETLASMLGEAVDLTVVTRLLLGGAPFADMQSESPTVVSRGVEGAVFAYERDDGAKLQLMLDPLGRMRWMETYDATAQLLIRIAHEEWLEIEGAQMPRLSRLTLPGSSLELTLKHSGWTEINEIGPGAFDTTVPEGVGIVPLEDALKAAREQAPTDD